MYVDIYTHISKWAYQNKFKNLGRLKSENPKYIHIGKDIKYINMIYKLWTESSALWNNKFKEKKNNNYGL